MASSAASISLKGGRCCDPPTFFLCFSSNTAFFHEFARCRDLLVTCEIIVSYSYQTIQFWVERFGLGLPGAFIRRDWPTDCILWSTTKEEKSWLWRA